MTTGFILYDVEVLTTEGGVLAGPVSLDVHPGRPVTILGETGSGKSLLAQAALGLLPAGLRARGSARIGDVDLMALSPAERAKAWGREVSYLPQEPWLSLDPLMIAERQIEEAHRFVGGLSAAQARDATHRDVVSLSLGDAHGKLPGQLSGGMAQRVVFAAARGGGARIVVADEPTKGLDEDRRRDLVALLKRDAETGCAVLTITHDPDVARALGGEVAIMLDGHILEQGPADQVLESPRSEYGRRLMAAEPRNWPVAPARDAGSPVLRGEGLTKSRGGKLLFRDFDIEVRAGEVVGVTGPSGCGKSTLGDVLLGLVAPDAGNVWRDSAFGRARFQKLYQDPPAAFPPHATLGQALRDLVALRRLEWGEVEQLMQALSLPEGLLGRRPSNVSGGELQRLALLRVLLTRPKFIFADEPSSRLDLISQQETIRLLGRAARERGCGVLIVSHDRDLIARTADRRIEIGGL